MALARLLDTIPTKNSALILGGFVFQGRWTEKGPAGEMWGLEMYRYDPVNKNFPIEAYTDIGSSYSGVMSISGNTFTFSGKFLAVGKSYDGRIVMTKAADGMSITLRLTSRPMARRGHLSSKTDTTR